ncbi:MAG TPA: LytTR family DNA-binding domain-containing protein [Kofleriaceae bacterium]|jgi:two-component system LytT family response regulator
MTPIRTVIIDDERLARASIRVLLDGDTEIELVGECATGADAIRLIRAQTPDLVFLDVEMPHVSGFDVLGALGPVRPFTVIFVTAFEQHAVAAFEADARDYVLKPFDDRRFARALERAKAEIRRMRLARAAGELLAPRAAASPPAGRIAVRDRGRVVFVPHDAIDWISADDYYVQLHVGAKSYQIRESLRDLEGSLDPQRFLRIHRSAIANVTRIAEVAPLPSGDFRVLLVDGTELRLSRTRRDRLRALL